jgi:SAM-dependent methyltransferase
LLRRIAKDEPRTADELFEDYSTEKELAARLMAAPPAERARLYSSLYDEMYHRTPRHPQLRQKASPAETAAAVTRQLGRVRPFLDAESVFLEVGPGDCALSLAVAKLVRQVYAVDVSAAITEGAVAPPNFQLILSDGVSIPVPPGSVDVAYSNQLMEHLHPDDAVAQLDAIARSLRPGGVYLLITPNRVSGPHDISAYFDDVATGFHLKEYTFGELRALLRAAGFAAVTPYLASGRAHLYYPGFLVRAWEGLLGALPARLRRRLAPFLPSRLVLGLSVVARKSRQVPL